MEEKKIIEEIARTIECLDMPMTCFSDCKECEYIKERDNNWFCQKLKIAKSLYSADYRKINKNSIVLTMEEADKIANEKFDFGRNSNKQYYENYVLPQARKEIIKTLIDSQILSTLINELEITNLFIKACDKPNEKLLIKRENLIKLIDLMQENLGG